MLHAKFQDYRILGSGEDFLQVFTIYGHGSHLGHVTKTLFFVNLCPPLPKEAPLSILSLLQVFPIK